MLLGPALMLAPATRAAAPEPTSAAHIVAALKREVGASTAYSEVRFSGLLDRPLILRGEMQYLGPGRLAKRVDTPYHERTTVEDGSATLQRGERPVRRLELAQVPELDTFLRGFSALLGGDAAALSRDFTLRASGDAARWQLELTPRDARLARRIASIRVDGAGSEPSCFRTREADGDESVLLVGPLAATPLPVRVSPQRLDALCRGIER